MLFCDEVIKIFAFQLGNPRVTAGVFLKALDKTKAYEETMSRRTAVFPHNFKQSVSE